MNKSIASVSIDKCTGCGACYNICPKNAIKMSYNNEGFIVPTVSDSCDNCGQCTNVCPAISQLEFHNNPDSYAVWASDEIRMQSSSGGMFTLLAEHVISNRGIVCGAAFTNDCMSVHHIWVETMADLHQLRGTKYVQSDTEMTYKQAKQWLEKGRMVLYTGCPCQIAGLYKYLGKNYDNLITADVICNGANSVKAFKSFIHEYSGGEKVVKVDFNDKVNFEWSTPTVLHLKNGNVKKASWNDGVWFKGIREGVINRQSCYNCQYAKSQRIADITMGDFWQVHKINPAFDDQRGTSLVLVNSDKGKAVFEQLRSKMKLCESVPLEEASKYNGQLVAPINAHRSRKFFFSHLDKLGYHKSLWYGSGKRYDVGIVGWWFASNYGSSLTYYALGTILENMNKQVLMVPISKPDGAPWEPEIKFTVDFLSKYFYIGKNREFHKMKEFNIFCDSFMLGSDQMWTGASTNLVGYTFFLDFVDKNIKKIAFSTSFGQSDFFAPDEVVDTAGDFLKRFDAISVRESSGVDVCKKRFGVEAQQVMDPVFFCSQSDYDRLCEDVNIPIEKKYLLCYILDPTPEKEAAAQAIAEREGLEVLAVMGLREQPITKEKWHVGTVLPRISSNEFLYYIKNCSYLLTDSHHGTCFGIIYKKPYAALVNASRGATRFETVANALGLRDRLFTNPLDVEKSKRAFEPIDYDEVERRLKPEVERGMKWLENALECPTKEADDTIRTIKVDRDRMVRGMSNRIALLEKQNAELRQKLEKQK